MHWSYVCFILWVKCNISAIGKSDSNYAYFNIVHNTFQLTKVAICGDHFTSLISDAYLPYT